MPELPEIAAYVATLRRRIEGEPLERIRIASFSLLRTTEPPVEAAAGKTVTDVDRLGKRIVIHLEDELALVIHLMVAGRLRWHEPGTKIPKRKGLAAFDFPNGTVLLTEEGSKRRASLHLVAGPDALAGLDPGGIEVAGSTLDDFEAAITTERHTLKRALTDARFISGIGGAYGDEILHRAGLSPLRMSTSLTREEMARLHRAAQDILEEWVEIRLADTGEGFPDKVSAFHPKMAVHGKYREPCPVCGTEVQRIRYSTRETNYCPGCQTDGAILADRATSRFLKDDRPKTVEDLE